MDGLYYEPRSFWSIANLVATDERQRIELPKKHFFNGERHPIEIRRIAFAAINYTVTGPPPVVPGQGEGAPNIGSNETSSVISRVRTRISIPQRYHFSTRKFIVDAGMAPLPTAMPQANLPATTTPVSSLWGQCNLRLDKSLIVPRNGAVEWQMSGYNPWQTHKQGGTDQDKSTTAWLGYQEKGGFFAGSARVREIELRPFLGQLLPNEDCWPYSPDGFSDGVGVAGGIPTSNTWWPPQSNFPAGGRAGSGPNARGFRDQESTRDGATELTELRTYIDQQAYDASFVTNAFDSPRQPTPLSLRVGTRIRTAGSGSQNWWWRPGAPLALVFDTITPAVVYELPRPFTLGPGEQVDIEMEFPPNVVAEDTFAFTVFRIGISLNGFAAIEG